jgi:hypothetical protein
MTTARPRTESERETHTRAHTHATTGRAQCMAGGLTRMGWSVWNAPLGDSNMEAWALALLIGAVMGAIGWFTTRFEAPPVYNMVRTIRVRDRERTSTQGEEGRRTDRQTDRQRHTTVSTQYADDDLGTRSCWHTWPLLCRSCGSTSLRTSSWRQSRCARRTRAQSQESVPLTTAAAAAVVVVVADAGTGDHLWHRRGHPRPDRAGMGQQHRRCVDACTWACVRGEAGGALMASVACVWRHQTLWPI